MNLDDIQNYGEEIYNALLELIKTPGPSLACARVLDQQKEIVKEYPMTKKVKEITDRFDKSSNIKLIEDHGNIVLVGGLDSDDPDLNEIRNIPIVLGAHLDEVTYLISNKLDGEYKVIFPLCSPPTRAFSPRYHPFVHQEAKILSSRDGELKPVGHGKFNAKEIRKIKRDKAGKQS